MLEAERIEVYESLFNVEMIVLHDISIDSKRFENV